MILYISGIPGAGKSTVGSLIASELGWKFIDIDSYITPALKNKLNEFGIIPEEDYVELLQDVFVPEILKAEHKAPVVVAGILLREKFADLLHSKSKKIFHLNLEVPYDVLKKRVEEREHFAGIKTLDLCWNNRSDFFTGPVSIDATQEVESVVSECVNLVKTLPNI